MKFLHLRVRTRIAAALAIMAALLLGISVMSIYNASRNSAAIQSVKSSNIKLVSAQNAMWELRFGVANFMTANADGRKKILGDEEKWANIVKDSLESYELRALNAEEKAGLSELRVSFQKYMASRPEWFRLYSAGLVEEAADWRAKNTNLHGAATVKGFKHLIELQQTSEEEKVADFTGANDSYRTTLLVVVAAALALSVAIGMQLIRSITGPLKDALLLAEAVSRGDLTTSVSVRSKDEVGQVMQALDKMNRSLSGIVADVRKGTDAIATASGEIAAGNQELSSRTEQQAGSLERTASSMDELTTTVKQNADNARQANQLAVSASDVVLKGNEVVSRAVTTMASINDSSKKIVEIISVIDGIAFQTNILALNAAVEAARAGEQGRGFAVVASEVRSLAQRSANAAKEIKILIGDSVEKVDSGTRLVNEAGATMDEILSSVKRVTDIMSEIMAATAEQSAGIEQVNQAVGQMDQVTQQNAALVEQAAAAAGALQDQANSLADAVAQFKLKEGGAPTSPAPRAAANTLTLRSGPKAPPVPLMTEAKQADDWEEF